ncbi:zinc-ribbon domain-containing protein [Methylococcus sp. EFPC2]|uniref:zinc-ribbon domain-containing protein n=1 Tax=Methylococcus sp. EFPC2 TaxID=2812648 RepID=UPI0019670FBD|nr:zinc ribbon domain-containing protein [Methylococcus sp. EFPC2]QSA98871.1 zinc-ribbon domain-containing protein [Methylococcus sp. EFPC2]
MSRTCPKCTTQLDERAETCPHCGSSVQSAPNVEQAPIRRLSGKLQAIGTIMVAVSIIAVVTGAWWGAALLFPSVIVFFMGLLL